MGHKNTKQRATPTPGVQNVANKDRKSSVLTYPFEKILASEDKITEKDSNF